MLVAALVSLAAAGPFDLTHSGRVVDASGSPVSGAHTLSLALVEVPSETTKWSQNLGTVSFQDGYYSAVLTGLDSRWFNSSLELAVTVDGTTLAPRSPLSAAPTALVAQSAPLGGATALGSACTVEGQLRYDTVNDALLVCDGAKWFSVGQAAVGIVESANGRQYADGSVARSCYEYKNPASGKAYEGAIGNGLYSVDPTGSARFKVYCDMTYQSGGWTLVLHSTYTGSVPAAAGLNATFATRRTTTIGSVDVYTGILTNTFYWMHMDGFKALSDLSTVLRFQSDAYPSHSVLTAYSMTSTFALNGNNESQIRTELCDGQANCFIDANGLSTVDADYDNYGPACIGSYNNQAWWYDDCFHYNVTWTSDRGHFSGYSDVDPNTNHWSWWVR